MKNPRTNKFWLSWVHKPEMGEFELHSPWWISGSRISAGRFAFDEPWDQPTICAAVQSIDEAAAKEVIMSAYDNRPEFVEWRFCEFSVS